ncbi:MAG: 16S rRNA (cytosine(967)-C(5))-methyltransferase RsmB [Thiotrichaceae bacterium]|nr:16S rRNA (cytosine(967)-C(5))-methyltransferase RsmB [Thiotrichaceae bacterium]PCI12503.1 MAG: 16S rRNA (cytosine(967)-C(5))-methyltransferase [Thiotrichales bacterium]
MKARVVAVKVLLRVMVDGRSLSVSLPEQLAKLSDPSERPLTQELCYGVMRYGGRLEAVARQLLNKPLKRKDRDVECLILLGLYQLIYMRIPPHAVVTETVDAVNSMGKSWAKGLVNAVLRNFQRGEQKLLAQADSTPAGQYAHPSWLLTMIQACWPGEWQAIVEGNNQYPPMVLRINPVHGSRDEYLQRLQDAGMAATAMVHVPSAVMLEQSVDVERLPGFSDGHASVQDGAAQLAGWLLGLQPGQRVLDACSAPGGKCCHILEQAAQVAEVVAIDIDEQRLQSVGENLARLKLQAKVICGDASRPNEWWDGKLFDRILLDAPCSASGVIRRHPDIKQLRHEQDIEALVALQGEILAAMWPLLAPGGLLLYATCSIFPQENHLQIERFLETHHDAAASIVSASWGRAMPIGRQILPGDDGMDGFYYAPLLKNLG